jgi:catalase
LYPICVCEYLGRRTDGIATPDQQTLLGMGQCGMGRRQPVEYKTQSNFNYQANQETWQGPALPYHWKVGGDIDYAQARALYQNVLSKQPGQQRNLAHNIAVHVANAVPVIQDRVFDVFAKVDPKLSNDIKTEVLQLSPRSKGQGQCPYQKL